MTHWSSNATNFVCLSDFLQAHSWARQPVPEFHIYEASGVGHFAVDGQTRDVARPGFLCQPLRILPRQRRTPTHRERRQRETETQRRVSYSYKAEVSQNIILQLYKRVDLTPPEWFVILIPLLTSYVNYETFGWVPLKVLAWSEISLSEGVCFFVQNEHQLVAVSRAI